MGRQTRTGTMAVPVSDVRNGRMKTLRITDDGQELRIERDAPVVDGSPLSFSGPYLIISK